jgi:ABC-type branched-subunit amino acid transport system substrate-binding protein
MLRSSRRLGVLAAAVAAVVSLAACGSQLTPDEALAARSYNGVPTQADGTVDPGTGTVDPGTGVVDPGTGAVDPGAGADPGDGGGNGGGNGGGDDTDPIGNTPKGSCDGFQNATGITDSVIKIGNSSDISGPVPGLFEASTDATRAFVAYFNATATICDRKLEYVQYDSRTDAGADQQSYTKMCEQVFAGVGSMSAFDSGGAKVAEDCGLPDLRSAAVTFARNDCGTCFGTQSAATGGFENAVPDYFTRNNKPITQKAAFLWLNGGAASENAAVQIKVEEARGFKFVYTSGIDTSEFNYTPYVQQMKDKGVQWVQFLGSYQHGVKLAEAMEQQGFKPGALVYDPTVFNNDFIKLGGSAVEDAFAFINFAPFNEAANNSELKLYTQWLQQVQPGAEPSFFGLFSWSAARLFTQQALALGGKLNRASLVEAIKKVDNWTANGLHSPQHVGAKRIGDCWRFMQVKNGKWVNAANSGKYSCDGVTYLK